MKPNAPILHMYRFFTPCVQVFARMTPDEKERLCLALKDSGRTCMMCGDGANDVGALKQAQVNNDWDSLRHAIHDARMMCTPSQGCVCGFEIS
ncbi:unnamed protein product [Sphacelaria rigidula]